MGKAATPELQRLRDMGLRDLFGFAAGILGYDKLERDVHGPLCEALQNPARTRINATMPRKFYKSTLCTIAYPLWRGVRHPDVTFLLTMNTVDNAKIKLKELQGHVERNPLFRGCYPEVIPDFNKGWSAESCSLRRSSLKGTPTFSVAGATTRVISRAVDEIVMDDLLTAKPDDSTGDEILPTNDDIQQAIGWYKQSLSLLNDPEHGRLLNVGTRWAQKDLVEYVLRTNERFRANNFEFRAVKGEWGSPDCVATMPRSYPMSALQEIAETAGSTIFRLWYLNEPIDPSELVFDLTGENFYDPTEAEKGWAESLRCYTAVDLAYSDSEKADNTAVVTIGVDSNGIRYVLDVRYGKYNPMTIIEILFGVNERWNPRIIGIESVAAQAMLPRILPHFEAERGERLPVKEIKRGGKASKEYRIVSGLQPFVERGTLKLPRGRAKPLEAEMRDFRMDAKRRGHDDALDALSDAVNLSKTAILPKPPRERRHITTEAEWADFYKKFYSVDEAVDALLRDEKRGEWYAAPNEFSYLRRN